MKFSRGYKVCDDGLFWWLRDCVLVYSSVLKKKSVLISNVVKISI